MIESISDIQLATLSALWTDAENFPEPDDVIWWEVWLRAGNTEEERKNNLISFKERSSSNNLPLSTHELRFPETNVLLLQASAKQIEELIYPLNVLSELRRAKETASFFIQLDKVEEQEWVDDAITRITPPDEDAPAVCLLDTGVNNAHPLLSLALSNSDMDSYDPAWGITDNTIGRMAGHGTAMAGLGLYGDLTTLLSSKSSSSLVHKLESVKIIPPSEDNPPELYGDITKESIARAEIFAPQRKRAICLTATTTDSRDRGRPSSWSASIDAICSGEYEEESPRRLIFVSAGNTDYDLRKDYPNSNYTEGVHDPGQAWNAITIGAYTEKDFIDPASNYSDCKPLALRGGLCPSSTTSLTWERSQWPYKPDIVLEGGNMATHASYTSPFEHESLRLLTTNADWRSRLLIDTGDTSAATAQAARMAAIIFAEYPNYWPETIRALLVNSAQWTPQMLSGYKQPLTRRDIEKVLRCYGYGVPNLEQALYSAKNSLTLIAQNQLQPFKRENGEIKTNEMHIHQLPWPSDVLLELGELDVEMRVTLSYFIEPNPGERGYKKKHMYASHGLRFDMKTSTESTDDFRRRINRIAREEVEDFGGGTSDSNMWLLGPNLRTRGSIHSDIWRGTAADLATKEHIAVYPVSGWWKELKQQNKWDSIARYSLVVTINIEKIDIDIYTPVANFILV